MNKEIIIRIVLLVLLVLLLFQILYLKTNPCDMCGFNMDLFFKDYQSFCLSEQYDIDYLTSGRNDFVPYSEDPPKKLELIEPLKV